LALNQYFLAPPICDPTQDLRPYGETVVAVTFIPFLSEYLTGVDYTLSACLLCKRPKPSSRWTFSIFFRI